MAAAPLPERFEVLEELASGETEVLWRARDRVLLREVVLKRPGPGLAAAFRSRDAREQVLQEARALARVRHPAVVRLLDAIETPEGPLLVLEPAPGETLAEVLARDGRLAPREVVAIGERLAGALEALHAAGVVHRGISAENVVLDAAGAASIGGIHFAKLAGDGTGFDTSIQYRGSSAVLDAQAGAPAPGAPRAQPAHPAPEQLRGEPADARADVFGLG